MPHLQNKIALITGASAGIGRAAAKLILGARRETELESNRCKAPCHNFVRKHALPF